MIKECKIVRHIGCKSRVCLLYDYGAAYFVVDCKYLYYTLYYMLSIKWG